jgi:hypothetical protein
MYKNFSAFRAAQSLSKRTARAVLAQRLLNIGQQISSEGTSLPEEWARSYAGVMQLQYDSQGQIQDVTDTTAPGAITAIDALISTAKDNLETYKRDLETLQQQWDDEAEPIPVTINLNQDTIDQLSVKVSTPSVIKFDGNNFLTANGAIIPVDADLGGILLATAISITQPSGAGGYVHNVLKKVNANTLRLSNVILATRKTYSPIDGFNVTNGFVIQPAGDRHFYPATVYHVQQGNYWYDQQSQRQYSGYMVGTSISIMTKNLIARFVKSELRNTTLPNTTNDGDISVADAIYPAAEGEITITSEVDLGLPNPDAKIAALNSLLA